MRSIKEAAIAGKKVLLRADLDGPLKRSGKVNGWQSVDEAGLEATLPTIRFLEKEGGKTIIIGHLDRPGGKVVESLRLDPVAKKLSEYLQVVHKIDDCIGPKAKTAVEAMAEGDVLLLENLRFHSGEENNDPEFAKKLASLADLYVNDSFATSHRKHASIVGIPKYLPSYAGLRLKKETEVFTQIRETPQRPLVFLIGGAKTETKIPLVKKLSPLADHILLGGVLMFAQELEGVPKVRFPKDAVRVDDIGPRSIRLFASIIREARTVVWNGPLGRWEEEEYCMGTKEVASVIANTPDLFKVAGGGDTVAALKRFNLKDKFDFLSTGGGAMLQFLAEGTLPGIEVLE